MTVHVQGVSESSIELSVRIFALVLRPGPTSAGLPTSLPHQRAVVVQPLLVFLDRPRAIEWGYLNHLCGRTDVLVRGFELRVWLSSRGVLFFP